MKLEQRGNVVLAVELLARGLAFDDHECVSLAMTTLEAAFGSPPARVSADHEADGFIHAYTAWRDHSKADDEPFTVFAAYDLPTLQMLMRVGYRFRMDVIQAVAAMGVMGGDFYGSDSEDAHEGDASA